MHKAPKITIGVILYKGEKYLPYSLQSLIDQDYPNIEFLFRDQSPNGEAYEFVKKELPKVFEKATMIKGDNRWHSGGHNDLINQMTGDYYICASNDMYYPPLLVSNLINELEKPEHQKYGTVTPKLMFWDFSKVEENSEALKESFTNKIDSVGIGIRKNHHFYDRGQGEIDESQYDNEKDIFGPSGALIIFRKSALNKISYKNQSGKTEYFDELIHYKNDVDLAYRLQWAGQKCLFLPELKVYHDRQVRNMEQGSSLLSRILKGRKDKNKWAKESSFFGHQVVLQKNYSHDFSLEVKIKTLIYQWASLAYVALREPYLLKQFKKLKAHQSEIKARKEMMTVAVDAKEIEKFMK